MRLYKTELYKLCHRKIFPIGVFCILTVLTLLFCQNLGTVRSTVNGTAYHGYEAVRIDRRITQEFEGVLTDDKIQQIVDKYGFPCQVEKYYGVSDGNYLNRFVMMYASNGYLRGWDDYRLATKALPLDGTALGYFREHTGEDIWFAYYDGWDYYTEWYYLGILMTSILILCMVSTVFSQEEQRGTKPLLFTTQEGPAKNITAKFAAAFTLSVGLWITITLFSLVLCGSVFGWESMRCLAPLVAGFGEPIIPFGMLLAKTMFLSLLGILELCALTLCVSACCHSMFHSVVTAVLIWSLPLSTQMLQGGIIQLLLAASLPASALSVWGMIIFSFQMLLYAMPLFMTASHANISELDAIQSNQGVPAFWIVIGLAVVIALLGMIGAWRRYRKY